MAKECGSTPISGKQGSTPAEQSHQASYPLGTAAPKHMTLYHQFCSHPHGLMCNYAEGKLHLAPLLSLFTPCYKESATDISLSLVQKYVASTVI